MTGKPVLVVDDEPHFLTVLSHVLRLKGYQPLLAASGREALDMAAAGKPWVALIDLKLADMSGFEVMRTIKQRNPEVECIVVTGFASQSSAIEAINLGAYSYVQKPYDMEHLLVTIQRAVEKREAVESLRASEERHRSLFERVPIGLYRTSAEGKILDANPALLQMLGCDSLETLLESDVTKAYADPTERARWQQFMEAEGTVRDFETRWRRLDGSIRWVRESATATCGADGRVLFYEGAVQDVTDRMRALERIRYQAGLLQQVSDAIISLDLDLTIRSWNRAAEMIYGWGTDLVIGQPLAAVLRSPGVDEATILREAIGSGYWEGELVRLRHDGSEVSIAESVTLLRDSGGRPTGLVTVGRDVTRHKQLEAQLVQAQKMELVGQLAGGVAHDFNNLLTGIIGYSDLVRRALPADSPVRADIEQVLRSARRASQLTQQLLAFSRRQMITERVVNLNEQIAEMNKMLHRLIGEDVELTTVPQPDLWTVKADPVQIEQVIINLAVNARAAMPDGGRLTIGTANVRLAASGKGAEEESTDGDYVMVSVTDTGVGMTPEVRMHMFEPFFTTKPVGEGTGLGLATVYGIVKQHGGRITVESEPGQGSTFRVYLPRVAEARPAAAAIEAEQPQPPGRESILVVEDEPFVRDLVVRVLRSLGYTVLEAGNGKQALELVSVAEPAIDLLVTDMVMPEMGGRELAERLRQRRPALRVLYTSGYSPGATAHHQAPEPDVALLQKPFTADVLAREVRRILDAGA